MYIVVDVESDGPIPGDYSMTELGAVILEPGLKRTFYAKFKPISYKFVPEALAVSGKSREETLTWPAAVEGILQFNAWIKENTKPNDRPRFASDNNGFDWQFVNWYFHHFLGDNPFGHSSTNIGSLYKGLQQSMFVNFKHLRKTRHDHNPVTDAIGNAEALLEMARINNLKM